MTEYRKKPVVIDAWQWHGHQPEAPEGEIVGYFRPRDISPERLCEQCAIPMGDHGWIKTLEGGHIVCPDDWIITGVEGENYPCKPHIFEATYERV